MRIAMIAPPWFKIPPEGYGGIEVLVKLLCDGLTEKGHSVTLYSIGSSKTRARLFKIYDDEMKSYLNKPPSNFLNVLTTHTLASYIEISQGGFDVVHDNTWKEGLLCSRFMDTPVVHTLHSPIDEENKKFYSIFLNTNADHMHFVTISNFQQKMLPGLNYAGTVYNGILLDKYPYSEKKDNFFFYIGRFNPEKAPHLACEVAKKLGLRLLLAGKVQEEAEHDYFDRYIKPYLGKDIRYVGEVGHWSKEKMDLFSRGRGYLYPIQWDEPFGITMVEAMACGTPVLTFRRGSTPEVIEHGVTGFIAEGMEEFIASIRHLDEIDPKQCRDRVKKMFTAQTMVDGYEQVFMKVAGEGRNGEDSS